MLPQPCSVLFVTVYSVHRYDYDDIDENDDDDDGDDLHHNDDHAIALFVTVCNPFQIYKTFGV